MIAVPAPVMLSFGLIKYGCRRRSRGVSLPQYQFLTKEVRPGHRRQPDALVVRANVDAGTTTAEWLYPEWAGEACETTRLPAIAPANAAKTGALVTFAYAQERPGACRRSFQR